MTQKNRFLKSAGVGLMLCAIILTVNSCIDPLYDIGKGISMDMQLGGDSLAIPIGSTDSIMLGDYLDSNTLSMLKTMEDGGYAITIKDSIEPTIETIDQSKLKIEDQHIPISTPIDFGDINLENFKIDGIRVEKDVNLSFGSHTIGAFPVDFSGGITQGAGINGFSLTNTAINIDPVPTAQNDLFASIPDPPSGQSGSVPVSDQSININASGSISSAVSVPGSVTSIRDVKMQSGEMSVTIELAGASNALTSGILVPAFTINPNGLIVFENSTNGNVMTFGETDQLNASNNYKVTKAATIESLNIDGNPNNEGKLPISGTIDIDGTMGLKNAVVDAAKFPEFKGMDMIVTIAFNNMIIGSMVFDIPTQHFTAGSTTNLTINNSLPPQLDSIKKISFSSSSKILINVIGNQYMPPIASTIDELTITFPKEFVFDETTQNLTIVDGRPVYKLMNQSFNPTTGKTIELNLKELSLNKKVSGGLNWSSDIEYLGKVSFGGTINSSTLPSSQNEAKLSINFNSAITFESAEVKTDTIMIPELNVGIPLLFEATISPMVKSLGTIRLKENTQIRLDILRPEGLPLSLSAENFQLQFPSFFNFNPTKNPPMPGNKLTLQGPIPDNIVLYLDALTFSDELTDGVLKLADNVSISGKVALVPGWVNSSALSSIADKNMSVIASTSDLRLSQTNVQLNDLSFPYKDSVSLKFDIPNLPEQLISLDSVLLKDNATIDLDVIISNMPDFGSPINIDLTIDFPDLLLFTPGTVEENNQLVINETITDSTFHKSIGIRGLKFDGTNLNGVLKIDKQLKYDARVRINSPNVNSDDLVGKVINIALNADITNIAFKSVYGKLDPGMDPIDQNIPLDEVSTMLEENNIDVTLDITKPVIAITTETNLGIPIEASVKVTPIRGGSPVTADEQAFTLMLPKAPTAQDLIKKSFWISPDSAGMPTGTEFIETSIQNLFVKVPEGIKMVASINTDKTMQHFIDLTATYKFKLGYEVTIPLAFGEDLKISIEKDIVDLDPKIGEMATVVGGIALLGTIQNSIPLELDLAVIPLDYDGNRIAIDTVKQIISAGAHDGSAVSSDLTLKLSDPDGKLKDLRGFRLIFTASSNTTVAGTPIKPENFVKADLKVRVDGGINVSKLMNE